jgi:hypothetical protein
MGDTKKGSFKSPLMILDEKEGEEDTIKSHYPCDGRLNLNLLN